MFCYCFFFFKQKTAYEMRISDWSSDVCSSDLRRWRELKIEDRRQRRNGRANDRHGEKRSSRNGIHRRQGRARRAPDRPERNRNQEADRAREEAGRTQLCRNERGATAGCEVFGERRGREVRPTRTCD